jgi:hypothetical protein
MPVVRALIVLAVTVTVSAVPASASTIVRSTVSPLPIQRVSVWPANFGARLMDLGYRVIGSSGYRAIGASGYRAIGPSAVGQWPTRRRSVADQRLEAPAAEGFAMKRWMAANAGSDGWCSAPMLVM